MKANKIESTVFLFEDYSSSSVRDFITLLKPRVVFLVVFTSMVGIYIAPGKIHPIIALVTVVCVALGAGAAAAINMWYDRDIDAVMSRTRNRPLPSGKIHPTEALHFAMFLAFASVLIMGLLVNFLSAVILAVSIFVYAFIYTIWLKRSTVQNIVIGGAAGAFPPMIGWSAVANNISVESIILFMIIFLWTPPHFWALAICKSSDYKKAGIPMLPIIKGIKNTHIHIIFYSVLLFLVSMLPYFINMCGYLYLTAAVFLGIIFIYYNYIIWNNATKHFAMFKYSIIYLFALFSAMLLDKFII